MKITINYKSEMKYQIEFKLLQMLDYKYNKSYLTILDLLINML